MATHSRNSLSPILVYCGPGKIIFRLQRGMNDKPNPVGQSPFAGDLYAIPVAAILEDRDLGAAFQTSEDILRANRRQGTKVQPRAVSLQSDISSLRV